jgi:two-component system sensor histidine kinase ChvG
VTDARTPDALAIRANKLDLLERLADDLAHEIKNPLHSMVINLEVLKRRLSRAGEGEDMLRYVGVLGGELDRVNHRIELLLRLSRPGRTAEQATLNELVEELMELIQLEARHREASVEYQPGEMATGVHVPRGPAGQVILNLVLHVLDGLRPQGVLRIAVSRDGDRAVVRVEGAGANGGAPQPCPDGAASERLAVAGALAEALGGRLEADGSAAALWLPSGR